MTAADALPTPDGRVAGEDAAAVRADYREKFALQLTGWGMQRMVARVFAALLVADTPTTTMPELAETLQASAGAISGAIRALTGIGLVVQVPAPGSRRDHYRIADDGWYQALMRKNQVLMEEMRTLADQGVDAVGPDTVAGGRFAEMRDFYGFIQGEVRVMLQHWETARAARTAQS